MRRHNHFTVLVFIFVMLFSSYVFPSTNTPQPNLEHRFAKGLTNYEPLSFALMQRAGNDPAAEDGLLGQALKASPAFPPVYFRISGQSLKDMPSGLFTWSYYFIEGFKAYGRNWWWAISLSGLIAFALIASFYIAVAVTVLLRLPKELPLLKHDIAEDKKHLFLLFLLVPAAFFGPGFFLATVLLFLGLYFSRKNRVLVYLALAFFAAVPFTMYWLHGVYSSSTPELRAVVAVNEGMDNSLALQALPGKKDFPGLFSYALALKREGRLPEAINAYKMALAEKEDPRARVNLANCYLLSGDQEAARGLYEQAIAARPSAEAFFDLAQLYRGRFNFSKGDELYRQAAKLDPDRVSDFINRSESLPGENLLMDQTLGMGDFLPVMMRRGKSMLFPFGVSGGFMIALSALWIIIFFAYIRKGRLRAFRCTRCSRILCSRCEHELYWGRMCKDCYQSLVKLEALDPKERVSRLLRIHGYQLRRAALIKALGFAPPGIAHIYGGNILWGALLLWGFSFFAIIAAANPLFGTGLSTLNHGWLSAVSIAGAILLYIISFAGIRRRQGKGWL
ncbi:MAG: hypothetical protein M0Z59_10715 [Nitrospiraceae bacterium]|nr:hypothetical protein [Nitrospiraceae bacterium]